MGANMPFLIKFLRLLQTVLGAINGLQRTVSSMTSIWQRVEYFDWSSLWLSAVLMQYLSRTVQSGSSVICHLPVHWHLKYMGHLKSVVLNFLSLEWYRCHIPYSRLDTAELHFNNERKREFCHVYILKFPEAQFKNILSSAAGLRRRIEFCNHKIAFHD